MHLTAYYRLSVSIATERDSQSSLKYQGDIEGGTIQLLSYMRVLGCERKVKGIDIVVK